MEDITDLKPYLNLREGEEILFVTRKNEDWLLPIKKLYKYHEPEKFPEELITKMENNYIFRPTKIITNFRIILFGLNFHYVKDDQVTPISEVFHFDNFIIWINNEDILDFEIEFGIFLEREIQFIFYHKVGSRDQKNSTYIDCFNYKNYLRIKELSIKLFKFKEEEIDQEEQRGIGSIIAKNKKIFFWGLIVLVFISCFSYLMYTLVKRDFNTLDTIQKWLIYSWVILYSLYLLFYLLFNLININNLQKIRKSEDFLKLIDIDLTYFIGPAWYKGPMICILVSLIGVIIYLIEITIYTFVRGNFLIRILIVGMYLSSILLYILLVNIKKKRKKTA